MRRIRRESGDAEGSPIVYRDRGDGTRPFPGDETFPFVKDPPDVDRLVQIRQSFDPDGTVGSATNPLPTTSLITGYEQSPEIDVSGVRQLSLILRYFPSAGVTASLLSVIPEARLTDDLGDGPGVEKALLDTIAVGDWPFEMVLSPDEATLYVGNYLDATVGVVDLSSGMMIDAIVVPFDRVQSIRRNASGSCLFAAAGTWSVTIGSSTKNLQFTPPSYET